MVKRDKSSVLKSIFRRNGEEGEYTKIIDDIDLSKEYIDKLSVPIKQNEIGVVLYYPGSANWVLLTNKRLLYQDNSVIKTINHSDIEKVSLALDIEYKTGVKNKNEFTRLLLMDKEEQIHLLTLEKGKPFQGFYQVLHFLSTRSKHLN
ncbi:MAG: hypothetical protein AAGC43_09505 [Bacteroidota bacterium]